MTLSWTLTWQVALLAAVISAAGLGYAKWLAWDFDRTYGRRYGDDARKPPAE